jgi:hypothetical protein
MLGSSVTIARYRGVPIKVHWSLPLVALLIGGLRFAPGAWIGWLVVVLLHEMGHAFWALRFRLEVREIMIHGFGGHCAYLGDPSPRQRAIVAWGGVMAQGLLYAIALPLSILVPASSGFQSDLYGVLIAQNLYVAFFNLMPIPPLDGAEAWKLVPMIMRREPRVERRDVARARQAVARPVSPPVKVVAGRTLGEALGPIDESAVRDTVRRALDEARRDSKAPRDKDRDEP